MIVSNVWSSRSPHYRWWAFSSTSGFYYNPLSWTYYTSTGKKRNGSAAGTNYGSNTTSTTGDVLDLQ